MAQNSFLLNEELVKYNTYFVDNGDTPEEFESITLSKLSMSSHGSQNKQNVDE